MKIYKFIFLIIILFFTSIIGCKDNINLDKFPLDSVSSEDYWYTAEDLNLFVNSFYPSAFNVTMGDQLQSSFARDMQTDDFTYVTANDRLRGSRSVPATGGWDYENIRNLNYFFENYEKCEDPFDSYKAAVGSAHFFRAWYFFNLVKEYGDVPYFTKTLDTNSEELYMERTPRNQVTDSIIADIDKAIEYLPSGKQLGGTKLSKEIAILFKSRVCLYEGTWEKYHKGTFGVSNANPEKYLNLAAEAANNLIESDQFSIYKHDSSEGTYFFFAEVDYSNNPEVLLWKKFDLDLGMGHGFQFQIGRGKGGGIGLTKSFVESHLCVDGKPISLSPLYQGDGNLTTLTTNRDPRLTQTIFTPGFPYQAKDGDTIRFVRASVDHTAHMACPTAYQLNKHLNLNPAHHDAMDTKGVGFHGKIVFRYAEVLLNYAEAKTELGTLSQEDVNKTINLLRDRVNMPNLIISNIENDPEWLFPELPPILNEIRRERRVELVAEAFRWDDIARWAAADKLIVGKRPIGAKFNSTDHSDLSPEDFKLTNGYFDPLKEQLPNGYGFKLDRDYLSPISEEELSLNPNLEQNPGW